MIDLTPLFGPAIEVLAGLLLMVGMWSIAWAGRKLKFSAEVDKLVGDSKVREYLEAGLARAIDYGKDRAVKELGKARVAKIEVENEAVEQAANYMIARVPEALARLGVTKEGVKDLVRARLPAAEKPAAAGK